ncbi:hypothetical protein KIW84_071438 [Lathyrus oleraceus]|uniref:Replication protein A 70 kDa DNA-binding subunit B/D first OB fold domain-containing protein n=1 Tax=Pisum sativum TaxID=3888 RepID=A0A9D4VJI4_PEA|nr:hypothetical protein KIW84_071438 [Pisum sativum]
MSRKVDSVKDINDSKETWRLAVRIMDVWSVVNNKGIEHLEMIVMDSLGDRIQVLIRHDHLLKWKEVIKENMTCIINNGSVYNNDFQWKVCDHSKKFVFLGGTIMKAIELQNIPPKGYFFKDFGEILQGKCKTDRLEDIIGAVSEINHIQSNTPGKKVVVSVVLKDLKLPTNEQKENPTQSAKFLSNWSGGSQYSPVERKLYVKLYDPESIILMTPAKDVVIADKGEEVDFEASGTTQLSGTKPSKKLKIEPFS